ncbi:hypothetical protein PAAG_00937 [Paracoccidioides lutzii Pb01]|uniref:Uncharacterized protein n=1 Tax=Paracoccidioides lutzii (strain ATCC MYA-826 / Pb01) TaxID=502779 RepID=C1GQZ2_PARBA|nr:hypothetical protein PAAG_00937 [Paracoccidioides lutzii Pb01]EEH38016.2 hypothetical protein PAAG_00937 [Paracoccidioides lutzii Pb01]
MAWGLKQEVTVVGSEDSGGDTVSPTSRISRLHEWCQPLRFDQVVSQQTLKSIDKASRKTAGVQVESRLAPANWPRGNGGNRQDAEPAQPTQGKEDEVDKQGRNKHKDRQETDGETAVYGLQEVLKKD